jgi:hypothetical protein
MSPVFLWFLLRCSVLSFKMSFLLTWFFSLVWLFKMGCLVWFKGWRNGSHGTQSGSAVCRTVRRLFLYYFFFSIFLCLTNTCGLRGPHAFGFFHGTLWLLAWPVQRAALAYTTPCPPISPRCGAGPAAGGTVTSLPHEKKHGRLTNTSARVDETHTTPKRQENR